MSSLNLSHILWTIVIFINPFISSVMYSIRLNAKSFDISPKEATIKLGNSATFNCSFTNINSKLITWIDPNGVTISSNKSNRFIVKIHETYSLLHIKNTQIQDKGLYVCIYDEMMNNAAKCNLNFKKETKIVNEELIKGDKRMLSCRDSDENDDLVWYFNDQVVPVPARIINIIGTTVLENTLAKLKCVATGSAPLILKWLMKDGSINFGTNEHGTDKANVTISVEYPPIIAKSNLIKYIWKNHISSFDCNYKSNPDSKVNCISEEYLQRLSGDYECSVKNRHGNNTQTYTLLIAEKPDILSNITIQKFQSGVIELTISSTNITGHLKLQKYLVEYRKYNETNEVNKYFNLTFKNQKWKKIEFAPNEKIRLYNFDAKTEYDIRMYAISAAGMGNAVCFRLITNNNYIPSMLGKYRTRTYHSWFNDLTIIISAIIGASFLIEKQKSFKNKNSKLRLEDNFNCNNVNQNGKKNEMQNLLIYKNGNIKCNTRKSNGKCETMTHKSLDKINNELKNGANSDKYHTENKLNKNLNNNVILHCNNEYCTLGRQNKIYSNRSNLQIINTDGFKKNRNKDNEEIYSVSKKMGHPVTNHYNSAHQTPIRSFKNTENSYSNITDYVENQDNGYSEIIEGYMSDSETKAFKIKIPSFYQIKNLPT
ncbi:hypothetical protein A3Q56_00251 [Intoshia linei]|uniref:Ig-like domain-containing protein n=1 Tax=Intoshia linei TaxID=1819745 RepID=A0A177BCM7_9BILA|nr:hypothetical protein A3Q56_00251 [Intoshia linei]